MNKSDAWAIETRANAAKAGRTKYWTGKLCARGHLSRRYTSSGICCKCNTENSKVYQRRLSNLIKGVKDDTVRVSYRIPKRHIETLNTYVDMLNET